MKSIGSPLFILIVLSICTASCNNPACNNTNPVFARFAPESAEYKHELAKQLRIKDAGDLFYRYDQYIQKNGKEFIVVDIQGDQLCAKGTIQVTDWNGISGMRREPSGYHGAEMKGLSIDIREDASGTHFLYSGLDEIID